MAFSIQYNTEKETLAIYPSRPSLLSSEFLEATGGNCLKCQRDSFGQLLATSAIYPTKSGYVNSLKNWLWLWLSILLGY